jgi:hydroxymethylglutaryl-CoA synthase
MKPGQLYSIVKIELMIMLAHRNSGAYRCCTSFVNLRPPDFDEHFRWNVYHMPFPGMALRAHRTLLTGHRTMSRSELAAHFEAHVAPSTTHARRLSGTYGASTFIGLLGIAETAAADAGDRIGIFAYGSGACGDFYSARLLQEAAAVAREAGLSEVLDARRQVSVDEYERIERRHRAATLTSNYKPEASICGAWYGENYEGRKLLTLDRIENYYRHYSWS